MAEEEESWTVVNSKTRSKRNAPVQNSSTSTTVAHTSTQQVNNGQSNTRIYPDRNIWSNNNKYGPQTNTGKQEFRGKPLAKNDRSNRTAQVPSRDQTVSKPAVTVLKRGTEYVKAQTSQIKLQPSKATKPSSSSCKETPKTDDNSSNRKLEVKPVANSEYKFKLASNLQPNSHKNEATLVTNISKNSPDSISKVAFEVSASTQVVNADPPQKKNKNKKPSKEARRRKREEKYYQALYQNKDSHIQFISADLIRKLQNENGKQATSNPKTCFQNPLCLNTQTSTPTQLPTTSTTLDFPSLNVASESNKSKDTGTKTSYRQPCAITPVINSDKRLSFSVPVEEEQTASVKPSQPATPSTSTSKGKKSKQPIVIDVSDLIKNKKESEKRHANIPGKLNTLRENHKITTGNLLDSSGPGIIHRGKIREKKKKPTKLKLTILKSRALRKILLDNINNQNVVAGSIEKNVSSQNQNELKPSLEPSLEVKGEVSNDDSCTDTPTTTTVIPSPTVELKLEEEAPLECKNLIPLYAFKEEIQDKCDKKYIESTESESVVNHLEPKSVNNEIHEKFSQLLDELSVSNEDTTITPELEAIVKNSMHNRKFRTYCDMYTSKELHQLVVKLLQELFKFQDRLYHTDQIKFKTKRRFVTGLKEALSYLNLNKVQLLLIAPDIEKNPEPGGLDEKINNILARARENSVPYIFSGSKYTLGKPTKLKTPVSIIAILDKQNCEETFKSLLEEASQLREKYKNDFISKLQAVIKPEA